MKPSLRGMMMSITSTSGAYADPVYDLRVMAQGQTTPVLAFPGEELSLGGITYIPAEPVSYPGLRIKAIPSGVLGVLYASFVLLIAALSIVFLGGKDEKAAADSTLDAGISYLEAGGLRHRKPEAADGPAA